ncbi:MICAL-like protein 1 [Xyrichtys novacula]|nr:MICAL-like protein 1 [Xyrichtys novacula]
MTSPKALLDWCRVTCSGYPNVEIKNMSTSFRDGLVFCAIIHKHRPDLIDFSLLSKDNVYQNNKLAFEIAETKLGIPSLLDPKDMVSNKVPDCLSIITYLSQLYHFFNRKSYAGPVSLKPSHVTLLNNLTKSKSTGAMKPLKSLADLKTCREGCLSSTRPRTVCSLCFKPVHLIQRYLIDGKVYHRSCFRCKVCLSALLPGSYTQGSEAGFLCCIHHLTESKSDPVDLNQHIGCTESEEGYFSLGGSLITSVPHYTKKTESQDRLVSEAEQREQQESREVNHRENRDFAVGLKSKVKKPERRHLPRVCVQNQEVGEAGKSGPADSNTEKDEKQTQELFGCSLSFAQVTEGSSHPVPAPRRMLDPSAVPVPPTRSRTSPNAGNASEQNRSSPSSSHISSGGSPKVRTNHPWLTIVHPGPWTQLPPAPAPIPAPRTKFSARYRPKVVPPNPFAEDMNENAVERRPPKIVPLNPFAEDMNEETVNEGLSKTVPPNPFAEDMDKDAVNENMDKIVPPNPFEEDVDVDAVDKCTKPVGADQTKPGVVAEQTTNSGNVPVKSEGSGNVPVNSEGSGNVPVKSEGSGNVPVNSEGSGHVPVKSEASGHVPVKSEGNGNMPVKSEGSGNVPVKSEGSGHVPVKSEASGHVPVKSEGNGNMPVKSEGSGNVPVKSEGSGNVPVKSEGSGHVPVKSEASGHVPVKSEGSGNVPVKSEASGHVPVKSEASGNVPGKSEGSGNVPVKSEASGHVPVKSEGNGNMLVKSEGSGNVPVKSEGSGHVPVKSDGSGNVPVKSEGSGHVPVKSEASGHVPVKSEGSGNVPVKSEASGHVPVKSEASGNVPGKSEGSGNVPVKSEASGHVPVKSEGNGNMLVKSEGSGNVPVKSEGSGHVPVKSEGKVVAVCPSHAENAAIQAEKPHTQEATVAAAGGVVAVTAAVETCKPVGDVSQGGVTVLHETVILGGPLQTVTKTAAAEHPCAVTNEAECYILPRSLSVPAVAPSRSHSASLPVDLTDAHGYNQVSSPDSKLACKENPLNRKHAMPKSKTFQSLPSRRGTAPGYGFPLIKRKVRTDQNISSEDLRVEMRELDKHLQTLEQRGVQLERNLRDCKDDKEEEQMLMEWFSLVHERNALVRRDAELVYLTKQQKLEERQADVEYELRCLLNKPEGDWTDKERGQEQQLMNELVTIIEERNEIISSLDQERLREREEDMLLDAMMKDKELQKEGLKDLKKSKGKFRPTKVFKLLNHKGEDSKDTMDRKS